jgi:hypothetical protein
VPSRTRRALALAAALGETSVKPFGGPESMRSIARILVPVALATLAAPALAQSNRCVDKDGKTVYMERPCATYGYRTEKQIKDPPKGDGTANVLRSGQAVAGSPTARGGSGQAQVQLWCVDRQIQCTPGETVVCGRERVLCDRD